MTAIFKRACHGNSSNRHACRKARVIEAQCRNFGQLCSTQTQGLEITDHQRCVVCNQLRREKLRTSLQTKQVLQAAQHGFGRRHSAECSVLEVHSFDRPHLDVAALIHGLQHLERLTKGQNDDAMTAAQVRNERDRTRRVPSPFTG